MNFLLDYYSVSLLMGAFATFLTGVVIYIHRPELLENRAWFYLNISSSAWSLGYFLMATSLNQSQAWFWSNFLHYAAIVLPLFYFLFVLAITKTVEKHKIELFIMSIIGLCFLVINPTTLFIKNVIPKHTFNFAPDAGPLYVYFTAYFFLIVVYSLWILYKRIQRTSDKTGRARLWSIIIFTIFGFAGGGSVFLLTFNVGMPPYPLILFALYPVISGYAVFRYQLFEVKVLTTEVLTFSIWLFLASRIVIAESLKETVSSSILLAVTVVLGIFLIRSVSKEVYARTKIQTLADDLARANDRLKELDQMKTEFLSLASHQIRAPITAIKGYASLLMEGNFGEINQQAKDAIDVIYQSGQNMALMVDDFLNISRIEQGRMVYTYDNHDLSEIIKNVYTELKNTAEKKGLDFAFSYDSTIRYTSRVDQEKIRQVFMNLIDNAIKYTPKGYVHLSLKHTDRGTILFKIDDSGVGIAPSVIPKLFEKFVRAKNAMITNVTGTGLGLYLVRQIVESHNGRVWVESKGEGKGASFFVELKSV